VQSLSGIKLASQYSGILGIAPDDPHNGPSFVAKLHDDGVVEKKMISLLLQKAPLSSYITFGGKSEFMMTTINGTQPLNFYRSTDNTRWKVRIFDLLIRDPVDKWAFYRMDEKG
jgi:hypothetical protein